MASEQIRNAFDCLLIDEDIDDQTTFLERVLELQERKMEEERMREEEEIKRNEEEQRKRKEELSPKIKACLERLRGLVGKTKNQESSKKVNGNGESGTNSAADNHQNNNGGQNGQISQNGAAINVVPTKGRGKSGNRNRNGHVRVNGASRPNLDSSSSSETKEGVDEEEKHVTNGDNIEKAKESSDEIAARKEKEEKRLAREKEREEENKKMTLKQYEKQLADKRIALEQMKSSERKVLADHDFNSMKRVQKKELIDDSLVIKQNADEELKKKEIIDKEMKARKSMNLNVFHEVTKGRGGNTGPRSVKQRAAAARASVFVYDDATFPVIGKVVGKA